MLSLHKCRNYLFQILLLIFLINVIICAVEYGKNIDEKCSVNLQCKSGCCQKDKCVETKECKKFRDTMYIVIAVVGVVLAAIFTIYLMKNLWIKRRKKLKKKQKKLKKKQKKLKKKKLINLLRDILEHLVIVIFYNNFL